MDIANKKLLLTNAAIGKNVEELQNIHLLEKNIAIYQRDISPLDRELEQLASRLFQHKTSGTIDEINSSLQDYFKKQSEEYPFLLEDISALLNLFRDVTKVSSFRIFLATVNTNMCRKFHTDVNVLRLLCTYVGPGTLWLPDEIVNRKVYHNRGENKDIVLDESLVQQVETGNVAILKGALYPEANAILHRSPTIEETGEKRLLLRIDTNESLNFWE